MDNVAVRREAYVKVHKYISRHRDILRSGGNPPDEIIPNFEKLWGRLTKHWSLEDFEELLKLLKSEVEIIENQYRRNPDWKK